MGCARRRTAQDRIGTIDVFDLVIGRWIAPGPVRMIPLRECAIRGLDVFRACASLQSQNGIEIAKVRVRLRLDFESTRTDIFIMTINWHEAL
jgi:hypothetical protein